MKPDRQIAYAALALVIVMALAFARQADAPAAKSITPSLTGRPELCLTCHDGIEEISASHPQEAFGCVTCHGGNALALDADLAHAGMRGGKNPSDFRVVEASCGGSECHSGSAEDQRDHIHRSTTSIQATYAGAIAQVRRSFGGQYSPLYQAAYMLGGLQIRALRTELVTSGKMSDRRFHDAILRQNRIPIAMLRAALTDQPLERGGPPGWRFYGPVPGAARPGTGR